MPTYEGLRLKVLKYRRKAFAEWRKRQLDHTDFTIISNNCWGGMVYESYNLPKNSPTVGLFFMAEDYVKFVARLREYVEAELSFVRPEESRWKDAPQIAGDKRFGQYPIGVLSLGDEQVEIFFLHYHSEQEATKKWQRRCQRINWDRLLVKFNDQNGCTEQDVKAFLALPFKNKLFFTCKRWRGLDAEITVIPQMVRKDFILASYEPFGASRHANITRILNTLERDGEDPQKGENG